MKASVKGFVLLALSWATACAAQQHSDDEKIVLTPPIKYSLEQALEFIDDDELVEITPKSIRIRKKFLSEGERRRNSRARNQEAEIS